jgi:cell division protein FtsI (penicillin-binding protein 3)
MNTLRYYIVLFTLVSASIVLIGRVLMLHTVERDFLQDQGDARTVRTEGIVAHRGMIQDRKGKPLAVSSPVGSVWADPKELVDAGDGLSALASALGVDVSTFQNRILLNQHRDFIYLRRHLPPLKVEEIMSLAIAGVYVQREYHRYYPAGEVAAQVLGFTNIDDEGQEGIELAYDEWLRGTPGKKKVLKNLYGQIVKDIKPIKVARPGRTLALSLDLRVQYHAYRELKTAIKRYRAESGSIVILDVATGEVLAMVNQPSFNPNDRSGMEAAFVRNRAVTDLFEPGSTVKPFTVAVALQSGKYTPQTKVDTAPGYITVGSKMISDPGNRGVMDVGSVIANSSQVGITKIALSLNERDIWSMFYDLGLGQSTGVGFPGESSGYLPNHRNWKDIERATFAYGYGLSVTPLQLARAYLVIASGGVRKEISLVKRSVVQSQRVMDRIVANQVLAMLQRVVAEGTGARAKVHSYTVAGKTGTVRKVGPNGYDNTQHMAFFAGVTPVKNPRLVAVVLINNPKSDEFGGGAIAAPVFSRVMTGALRLLDIPPDDTEKVVQLVSINK